MFSLRCRVKVTTMNSALRIALTVMFLLTTSPRLMAGEVVVAAASDLSAAAKEFVALFERETGHTVKLTLGSSGNFHSQIVNGAPFDVFLSADMEYVRDLEKTGFTEPGTAYVYAIGRLVLWTRKPSLDLNGLGMKSLQQSSVRKIAIANPSHAPYGRAAVQAMEGAGIYDAAKGKLVLGENVSQTAQFAQSGAADVGIIALALALSDSMKAQGKYWEIPRETYSEMEQGAVMLKQAQRVGHTAAARSFLETLRGPQARAILSRYGFGLPDASTPQ